MRPPFVLSAVSSHFIWKQFSSLNPQKAIGLDDISALFLRDAVDLIAVPVSHILNLSLLFETVPRSFKEARDIPLYKKRFKIRPQQLSAGEYSQYVVQDS